MRREWDLDDLIASWTLVNADQEHLVKLHPPSWLSFALMAKFFEIEGQFPRHAVELPPVVVDFVARQLGESADAPFEVTCRAMERFRVQIREMLGFRVFTRGDEDKMIAWLAQGVCPSELNDDRQREAVLARRPADHLEPPGRMSRIIGSANRIADELLCATIAAIHYGREAELPGADREAQDISMLALHLLQSALVLVNTRLVDRVLDDPDFAGQLNEHDLRGLTPLLWSNVALHGTFELDLDTRIDYDRGTVVVVDASGWMMGQHDQPAAGPSASVWGSW